VAHGLSHGVSPPRERTCASTGRLERPRVGVGRPVALEPPARAGEVGSRQPASAARASGNRARGSEGGACPPYLGGGGSGQATAARLFRAGVSRRLKVAMRKGQVPAMENPGNGEPGVHEEGMSRTISLDTRSSKGQRDPSEKVNPSRARRLLICMGIWAHSLLTHIAAFHEGICLTGP